MITDNFVPEKINEYNVYMNGTKMIGLTEDVSLPEINMKTDTVEGPGIKGEIDSPTIGQFESMPATLKFRTLYSSAPDLMDPTATQNITLRAAQQVLDRTSGYAFKSLRIVLGGRTKSFNPGTVQRGEGMDAELVIEVTYYLIEVDGQVVVEIDKLNDVYKVNGKDLLADINAMI